MTHNFEDFQKFGKEQLESASSAATSVAKALQNIAAETGDYSKRAFQANSDFVQKLSGAKSLDSAIQIQSEYAKSAYGDFVAQVTKIGELCTSLAKNAFKPLESAIAKIQASTEQANAQVASNFAKAQDAAETQVEVAARLIKTVGR